MDRNQRLDLLIRFADVLLPGDDLFPSASGSGMAESLFVRLSTGPNAKVFGELEATLTVAGEPSAVELRRIVPVIEKSERKLFEEVRKIVYITYYEQDSVITAIRSLGTPYNVAPLPDGYPIDMFDGGRDAPKHRRGHWIATDQVTRVDLSAFDHLGAGE
jgi:hypothetical protein